MRSEQVSCNVCREPMTSGVMAVVDPDRPHRIGFAPWDLDEEAEAIRHGAGVEHICGEKCAHIRLSRALATTTQQQLQEAN